MSKIHVKFWGVRGSVPSPLSPAAAERKVVDAVHAACCHASSPKTREAAEAWVKEHLPFHLRSTFGGNTTCVEVRCGDELIVFDMGTGLRELGNALIPAIFKNKGQRVNVFQSHVHWDHIQGFPFFAPIFFDRAAGVEINFHGGMEWQSSLDQVLEGQMDEPVFPVKMEELEQTKARMAFKTVSDGAEFLLADGAIKVVARKLNHPQITFGYRVEYGGESVAFCTDHEPFGSLVPDRALVALARDAGAFITDCQYSHDEYTGVGKPLQKFGWGHSYPEYIARVAAEAKSRKVVTTHHDPASDDARIVDLARTVQDGCKIETVPAYEGLVLSLG